MKNYTQEGKILRLTVDSGDVAGDPVMVGDVAGVCVTDYDAADGKAEVRVAGVCDLTVAGVDESGDDALVEGESVYYDLGVINGDSVNGKLFGKVLAAVASGASGTRSVLLVQ